jgi:PRC-barrel domain
MRIVAFLLVGSLSSFAVTGAGAPSVAAETPTGEGAHSPVMPQGWDAGMTAEERMNRRFPQPVRTGDLIGLPLLDSRDRTLGHVRDVERTPEGKVVLIVPIGGWFGWGARPVGIPIETVAIRGKQLVLLDIKRADLPKLPTWSGAGTTPIERDERIRVALGSG